MVRRLAWILAIVGALAIGVMTVALFSPEARIRVPAIAALITFCAIVISYLGGIEGGLALQERGGDDRTRAVALAVSAVPPLAAWAALLRLPSAEWQIGAFIGLFIAVWAADLWFARRGLIPAWFVDLRTAVTAAACALLAIAFWQISKG